MRDRDFIRRLMNKLSVRSGKLPTSLFLKKVTCLQAEPCNVGAFSDIFVGQYEGQQVALKRVRMFQNCPEGERKAMVVSDL